MNPRGRTSEPTPHVCRGCTLPLVQPQRVVAERMRWRVYLRCPSCGWTAEELLDEPALKRLDEELERGTQQLIGAMRRITDVNMRDYVERFVSALAADAIVPADF
jgi:RNase P subunit RPR2